MHPECAARLGAPHVTPGAIISSHASQHPKSLLRTKPQTNRQGGFSRACACSEVETTFCLLFPGGRGVRAFALKRRVSWGTQGAADPSQKRKEGKTSPGATSQWDTAGGMGFGNIAVQAQVLSRRGERLPGVTASVAMHESSNRRGSCIFWVVYSDHAADLGGVRLPG